MRATEDKWWFCDMTYVLFAYVYVNPQSEYVCHSLSVNDDCKLYMKHTLHNNNSTLSGPFQTSLFSCVEPNAN